MSKRGSTRPWKITFGWLHPFNDPEGPSIYGSETRSTRDEAETLVRQLQTTSNRHGIPVSITFWNREQPDTCHTIYHEPEPEESE
jgi:hypothetical protein